MEKNYIEVIAEYFDSDAIRVAPVQMYRIDIHGERHYFTLQPEKGLRITPSATTLINKYVPKEWALIKWMLDLGEEKHKKIMAEKAFHGTLMHTVMKDTMLEIPVDLTDNGIYDRATDLINNSEKASSLNFIEPDEVRKDAIGLLAFAQKMKRSGMKVLAVEIPLQHPELPLSGCIDLVMAKDSETYIFDYKTNREAFYASARIQLAMYRELWNATFPDRPCVRIYNFGAKNYRFPIGKTVEPFRLEDQTETKETNFIWPIFDMAKFDGDPDFECSEIIPMENVTIANDISALFKTYDLRVGLIERMAKK